MKRLDILEKELEQVKNMDCLAFNIKEQAVEYYEHEIKCIKEYGSPNPEYSTRKFINMNIAAV